MFRILRTYFVWLEENDPVVIAVEDNVNRPNNTDCDEVLKEWIYNNYGITQYDYWEIDTCEKHYVIMR